MPKDLRKFIQNYKFFNVMPFVSGIYGPPNVVLSFHQPPMTGPVTEDVGEYFAVCDTCNDRAGTYQGRMPWNCGIQPPNTGAMMCHCLEHLRMAI